MIGRPLLATAVIGTLLMPACSSGLGATAPFCPPDIQHVRSAIVMEAQAVPSARFGPCLARLEPGWTVHDLAAESGRAWFWLDSDRVGDRFLSVSLVEGCDTTGAQPGDSGIEGISLFTRTQTTTSMRPVAVITVAERHVAWAEELAGLLRDQGHSAMVSASGEPLSERIDAALGAGEIALIVDDGDVENRTAAIRTPESPQLEVPGQSLEQLLRLFEAGANDERFTGDWFLTFAGGCIIYEFDAEGPGAASLAERVRDAMDVVPLDELKDDFMSAGSDV